MRFLVINIGSSSCKYALFDANEELVRDENIDVSPNSADVVKYILRQVGNVDEIGAIVHRLVHGGDEHGIVEEITPDLTAHLAKLTALTPLHSPLAVAVIQIFAEFLPTKKQYAVFDSGWFKDLLSLIHI